MVVRVDAAKQSVGARRYSDDPRATGGPRRGFPRPRAAALFWPQTMVWPLSKASHTWGVPWKVLEWSRDAISPCKGWFYSRGPRLAPQQFAAVLHAAFRVDRSSLLRSVGRFDMLEPLNDDLHRRRRP